MNKKTIIIIGMEILIFILLYYFVNSEHINIIPKCWVYNSTGLLCPSCGGTRFVIYLLKGDFIKAFLSHIVFFIGIIYLFILNIVYLINLNKNEKIIKWIYPKYWYVIIFVITLIIYTIVRNLL